MDEKEIIELNERLEKQENLLIEQEHRFLKVLQNFFIKRRKWKKGDKKRNAATRALLYSLFFSPTTVAVTGGTVAVISLFVLFWQTEAVIEQNNLLRIQNEQQNDQFVSQRITELTSIIYDTTDNLSIRRLKSVALVEYIDLQRTKHPNQKTLIDLREAQLKGITLDGVKLDSIDFSKADFREAKLVNVSIKNSVLIVADFRFSNFDSCYFHNSEMKYTQFGAEFGSELDENDPMSDIPSGAKFTDVHFRNCRLIQASFIGAYLIDCSFYESEMHEAYFSDSWLPRTNFSKEQVEAIYDLPEDYLSHEQYDDLEW